MSDVLKYRNDGSVEWFTRSLHEIPYLNEPNYLIGSLSVPNVPMKYWKVEAGNVREMTLAEKTVVDQSETELNQQMLLAEASKFNISTVDLLKIILPKIGMTKTEFITAYKQLKGL